MKIIIRRTLATALAAGGVLLSASAGYAQADGGLQPGLAAAFSGTAGGKAATDTAVLPNVWLHVPAGQPPTPFIDAAPFTVAWTGFVNLDLRAEYAFQAELNGSLKLEVNGEKVLEGEAGNGSTETSKLVRLNKGTNSIAVAFKGPGSLGLHANGRPLARISRRLVRYRLLAVVDRAFRRSGWGEADGP